MEPDTRDVTFIEKELFERWKGVPPNGFQAFQSLRALVTRETRFPETASLDTLNGLMLLVYQALLRKHQIAPRGVVHVGAHTGSELQLYLKLGFARALLLEPNPILHEPLHHRRDHYNQLVGSLADLVDARLSPDNSWARPWCVVLPYAAGARDAEAQLHCVADTRLSSLLPIAQATLEGQVTGRVTVPLRTLDSIADELRGSWSPGELNVMWVNVQGTELDVLRGAAALLAQLELVAVELSYERRYQDESTPAQVDACLRSHGFAPTFGLGVPQGGMRFYARLRRPGDRYQAVEGETAG
jgi:FkbM family methyltransferase